MDLTVASWGPEVRKATNFLWFYQHGEFTCKDIFADADPQEVGVLMKSHYEDLDAVRSSSMPVPYAAIAKSLEADMVKVKSSAQKPKTSKETQTSSDLLSRYPWMSTAMKKTSTPSSASAGAPSSSGAPPAETRPAETPADAEQDALFEQAYDELERAREQWHDDKHSQEENFVTAILGGKWQVARTGRSVYGVRVDAKAGTSVHTFLKHASLHLSASFDFHTYGEDTAYTFAGWWKQRVLFLHGLWKEAAGLLADFPLDRIAEWRADPAPESLFSSFNAKQRRRADAILKLAPSM